MWQVRQFHLLAILLFSLFSSSARADITHIVLVWMNESAPSGALQNMIEQGGKLSAIAGVSDVHIGPPLASERPVVDDSFALGITMRFPSKAVMEAYLADSHHSAYVADYIAPYARKLVVYDIEH